jgi:hypothetical protein
MDGGPERLTDTTERWSACLLALGIPDAHHVQRPHREPSRRIYRADDSVFKIEMSDGETTSTHYRNNLREEWDILRDACAIPGVVEARGFSVGDGWQAMELEYLSGRDLQGQIDSSKAVARFTAQLFGTLFGLSMIGIAHNDVLPRNVLLGTGSRLYLLDFDQATRHHPLVALYRNFLGLGWESDRPYGALMGFIALASADRILAPEVREWLRAHLSRERRHQREIVKRREQRPVEMRELSMPKKVDEEMSVLLILFNRPRHTRLVFEAIREARPPRLFIAADGPRPGEAADVALCAQARAVARQVDWSCDVRMLESEVNLGCKRGPETAISWFFDHVESGIILEDDCLPSPSFFDFATSILRSHRDRSDVMMVCGTNLATTWHPTDSSYHYAYNATPSGWASWRDAWSRYDPEMTAWTTAEGQRRVKEVVRDARHYRWRRRQFDMVCHGGYDAWDWAWTFTRLYYGACAVIPAVNLVSNIGFGPDATHTRRIRRRVANLPRFELPPPYVQPEKAVVDGAYDHLVYRRSYPLLRQMKHAASALVHRTDPRPSTGVRPS